MPQVIWELSKGFLGWFLLWNVDSISGTQQLSGSEPRFWTQNKPELEAKSWQLPHMESGDN